MTHPPITFDAIADTARAALAAAKAGDDDGATDALTVIGESLVDLNTMRLQAALAYATAETIKARVVAEKDARAHDDLLKRARSIYAATQGAVVREQEKRALAAATTREDVPDTGAVPTDAQRIAQALRDLGLAD